MQWGHSLGEATVRGLGQIPQKLVIFYIPNTALVMS